MKDNDLLICTLEEKLRIATEALTDIKDCMYIGEESYVDIIEDLERKAGEALSSIERCETGGRT